MVEDDYTRNFEMCLKDQKSTDEYYDCLARSYNGLTRSYKYVLVRPLTKIQLTVPFKPSVPRVSAFYDSL